jgi:ribonuclease R
VHRAVKHLLRGGKPDQSAAAIEALRAHATVASTRERAAMEVEREVVDLYRTLLMRDKIGQAIEGTVTAVVGSGLYVTLDQPFVDVLVRWEALGPDHYEASENELEAIGLRSGDRVALGDRILVQIDDVAVLRRAVFARRIPPENVVRASEGKRGRRGARDDRAGRLARGGKKANGKRRKR